MHHLFAFPNHEGVEEVRDGLRIVGARAAAQDQRVLPLPIPRVQRDAAQFEHREHRGVAELELQGEPDHVEGAERRAAFDGEQRLPLRLQ